MTPFEKYPCWAFAVRWGLLTALMMVACAFAYSLVK